MGHEVFHEVTRKSIPLTKNDGVSLTWQDSTINVRTDKGMTFLELSRNFLCLDKNIDMLELLIASPKSSPAKELCRSNFVHSEMNNYDYTEMIIDSSFWPHNKSLTQEMTNIVMSFWSPSYFYQNQSVLAILNNIGGVEFFVQQKYIWKSILQMSSYIEESLKYNKSPQNFEELKDSVYTVETSAICWAPELNSGSSCYFVTAQKNSTILFWQINISSKPLLLVQLETNIAEILSVLWIPRPNNHFWLLCSDILGQMHILDMYFENNCIYHKNTHKLWQYKDRMVGSHLNYDTVNEKIVLIYSKHRHLVLQLLDDNCNVLLQYVNNINDFRITDITKTIDGYYLSTVNVNIFKLNINVTDSKLNVDLIPITLKETYASYELYSLSFSNTNTMAVLGMIDRKLHCRKEAYKIELIIISTENKLNSLIPTLLSNPHKKLTKYWDCIEALRYKIRKTKIMPDIDYNELYVEGSNDIYKRKIYLFLVTIYLNMKKIAAISSSITLPESSIEKIKEGILLLHAQTVLDTLHKKHEQKDKLSDIEEETLYGCVKYLHYYSIKHKNDLLIDDNTYSTLKTNFIYICQSCDGEINDGFTCINGHLNMYCILSFTPITSEEYLVCKSCQCTARADLSVNLPLCVFCDQYLNIV